MDCSRWRFDRIRRTGIRHRNGTPLSATASNNRFCGSTLHKERLFLAGNPFVPYLSGGGGLVPLLGRCGHRLLHHPERPRARAPTRSDLNRVMTAIAATATTTARPTQTSQFTRSASRRYAPSRLFSDLRPGESTQTTSNQSNSALQRTSARRLLESLHVHGVGRSR
jgi:hypothetical protein